MEFALRKQQPFSLYDVVIEVDYIVLQPILLRLIHLPVNPGLTAGLFHRFVHQADHLQRTPE